MYSVRGWRGNSAAAAAAAAGSAMSSMDTSVFSTPWSNRNRDDYDDEEVDGGEEKDVPAPLPSEQSSARKPGTAKGTSAKDKRRLREKRRSTGVATLSGHEVDELTTRNTSLNEAPALLEDDEETTKTPTQSHLHSTSVSNNNGQSVVCSASSNDVEQENSVDRVSQNETRNGATTTHHSNNNYDNDEYTAVAEEISVRRLKLRDDVESDQSLKSVPESTKVAGNCSDSFATSLSPDFARNLCARPFEAKRGILKTPGRPIVSPKPQLPPTHASSRCLPASGQRSSEEIRLMSRISELESLLESERKEKVLLEKVLSVRDNRIRELESHIVTLNEDLDLADEDYLRIEEENRALTRALSQLNVE